MIYIHCLNSRVNWHLPFSKIFLTLSCNIMPWSSLSALQRVNSNILTVITLKTKHTIVCIGVSIPSKISPPPPYLFLAKYPSFKSANLSCPKGRLFSESQKQKYYFFSSLLPSSISTVTKFVLEISQFKFLVIKKNI